VADVIPVKKIPGALAEFEEGDQIPRGFLGNAPGGFRNVVINGAFQFNPRALSGTVVLAAGARAFAQWKAGASGCTFTFTPAGGAFVVTITAGTLVQVVDGKSILSGPYVLSWNGTSQGRINSGAYSPSGVSATLTAGSNATIEFGVGSLSMVQLEQGTISSFYEYMSPEINLDRCYPFCRLVGRGLYAEAPNTELVIVQYPAGKPMRDTPNFGGIPGSGVNGLIQITAGLVTFSGFGTPTLDANGGFFRLTGVFGAGARYIVLNNFALLSAEL
jgi:hypothetical protein